jgi:uncharacterized protein YbaA (DUF1428 family)
MSYVDGFILPVPKRKLKAYLAMARTAGKVWKKYGALDYRECVADDVKKGRWTSFPRSVKLKRGETVVFSYIVYKSRAHRDRINAQVMTDPRMVKMIEQMKADPRSMPFDGKRMIWGGFKSAISL